jgi:DNA mismatch repair ATPase MutS
LEAVEEAEEEEEEEEGGREEGVVGKETKTSSKKEGGRRGRRRRKRRRRQSLVILDELGRGTATYDGMAIAEATLKYLVKKVGCPVVFVTHYPQLGEVGREEGEEGEGGREEGLWVGGKPKVKAGHMAFLEGEEGEGGGEGGRRMTFLYKLKEGEAGRSYGLNVARMAGMDEAVLERARGKSRELEARFEVIMMNREEGEGGREEEVQEAEEEEEGEEGGEGGVYERLREAVRELEGLEESGVSQKEYVRKQREILASLIVLQEDAKKVVSG